MGLTVYGGGGKPEEEKTVTAGTSVIEVNPSSGKVMKKVTVNPTPTESKSVTPTTSELTVTPSEGKHLSQVVVGAVEDVTPEVTAQTPVITQIAENLGVTITTPSGTNKQILQGNNANLLNIKNNAKKEGLYVWKKLTAQKVRLSFTVTNAGTSPTIIQVSSNDIDLSTVDAGFFKGVTGIYESDKTYTFLNGSLKFWYESGSSYIERGYTYDASTKQISVSTGVLHNTLQATDKIVLGDDATFVTSDENKYPDGEIYTDGYYYKNIGNGVTGIDFGEVTIASKTLTFEVEHGLKSIPKAAFIIGFNNPKPTSEYICIEVLSSSKIFTGSYGDVYGIASTGDTSRISESLFSKELTAQKIKFTSKGGVSAREFGAGCTYEWFAII